MKDTIRSMIDDSIGVKEALRKSQTERIEKAVRLIIKSLSADGKLLIFGNGGSAADSQHMAAELVGRFKKERRALGAIALSTNTSTITAIANDYGYDVVFSRQVEALGRKGDVAIGISTSGSSKNVLKAMRKARSMGLYTIGILGCDGGVIKKECDIAILAESKDTPRIQEAHSVICHIICALIEEEMFT